MKFIVGVATGIVLGIAGAIAYSFKSGRDLREVFETTKSDIENADFDEMGKQLDAAVSTATDAINKARGKADSAGDDLADAAGDAVDDAADTATDLVED